MAPGDTRPGRVTTPTSKEAAVAGVKSPEKPRSQASTKSPAKSTIPPKRPLVSARSQASATDRERPKPTPTPSTGRRPLSSATGPRSASERKTARVLPASKPPIGRTPSRLASSRPKTGQPTTKQGPTSPPAIQKDEITVSASDLPVGQDQGVQEGFSQSLNPKDSEIERLRGELNELRSKQHIGAGRASDSGRNTQSAEHTEEMQAKADEIARIADAMGVLEKKLQVMEEDTDKKIEEADLGFQEELQNIISNHEAELENLRTDNDSKIKDLEAHHKREMQGRGERQKELEETKSAHERDLAEADTRHAQQLKKAAAQHKQQLDEALEKQRDLREIASKVERELDDVKAKHEQDVKHAISRNGQELKDLSAKHDKELDVAQARHEQELKDALKAQRELRVQLSEFEDERKEDAKIRQDLQDRCLQHEEQLKEALRSQKELRDEFSGVESERKEDETAQQKLQDKIRDHEEQLKKTIARHEQSIAEITSSNAQERENAIADYQRRLEEADARHEDVRSRIDVANQEAASTRGEVEKLREERDLAHKDVSAKHERELREAAEASEQKYGSLQIDKETIAAELDALHMTLKDTDIGHDEAVRAMLSSHEQKIRDQASEYGKEIDHLCEQKDSTAAELDTIRATLKEMETKHNEAGRAMSSQYDQKFRDQAAEHGQEIDNLRKEKEATATELDALRATLQAIEANHNATSKAVSFGHEQKLRDQASQHEIHARSLRGELDTAVEEAKNLRSEMKTLDERHSEAARKASMGHAHELQDAAKSHEKELSQLRSEHRKVVAETKSLKAHLEAVEQDQSKSTTEALLEFEKERTTVLTQRDALRIERDTLVNERDAALAQKAKSEASQKLKESEKQDILRDASVSRRALGGKKRECEDLHEKHKAVLHQNSSLQESIQGIDDNNGHTAKERTVELQDELEHLRNEHNAVSEALISLQQSSNSHTKERDESSAQIASLGSTLENLEAKHTAANEALLTSHQNSLRELHSAYETSTAQLATLQQTTTDLTKALDEARKEIAALKQQLADRPSEDLATNGNLHADLHRYISVLRRQYKTDVADIEALKTDMDGESARREEQWRRGVQAREVMERELRGVMAAFTR